MEADRLARACLAACACLSARAACGFAAVSGLGAPGPLCRRPAAPGWPRPGCARAGGRIDRVNDGALSPAGCSWRHATQARSRPRSLLPRAPRGIEQRDAQALRQERRCSCHHRSRPHTHRFHSENVCELMFSTGHEPHSAIRNLCPKPHPIPLLRRAPGRHALAADLELSHLLNHCRAPASDPGRVPLP
jgi:hypothetical protein